MKMKGNLRRSRWGVMLFVVFLVCVTNLFAQTYDLTWEKTGENGNWSNANYWQGPTGYVPDRPERRAIFNNPAGMGMPIQNEDMYRGLGQLVFNYTGWTVYSGGQPLQFKSQDYFSYNAINFYNTGGGTGTVTINPSIELLGAAQNIHTASGATLVINGGFTGSYAPIISSFNATSSDTGAVRLDVASSTTGAFYLRQGTLLIRHSNALGAGGGTVNIGGDQYVTNGAYARLLTDASGVSVSKDLHVRSYPNRNVLAIIGANHTSGSSTFSGNLTLDIGASLTAAGTSTVTFSGAISGVGGITKTGAGTVILSNSSNTYSGGTTIAQGTLRLGQTNALPSGTSVTMANSAGVTLDLDSNAQTVGELTGGGTAGGNIALGSAMLTIGSGTYDGVISGSGNLVKSGTGTLTLGGGNTYTGGTTIQGGTLKMGAVNALPSNRNVTLADVAGAGLDLDGYAQTLGELNGGGASGGNISLGGATLTVGSGTYNGVISGSGELTKTGAGTLTLGRANSYGGTTTISAGTLRLGAANGLPNGGNLTLADAAGAVFDLNGYNQTLGELNGGGASGGNIALGSATLTVGSGTYNGVISGSGGLTKTGAGTLTLGRANSYGGTTTISAGTLRLGVANGLPNGGNLAMADAAGAVFDLNGYNQTLGELNGGGAVGGNITLGSGTLTVGSGTYIGGISGSGSLVKAGAGVLELGGANSYAGGTTIAGGTLRLRTARALPENSGVTLANEPGATLDLNGHSVTIGVLSGGGSFGGAVQLNGAALSVKSGVFHGGITGSGALVKVGEETLTLAGSNAIAGPVTVSGGTLQIGQGGMSGSLDADIVNNGVLVFNRSDNVEFNRSISGTGKVEKLGLGTLLLGGSATYEGGTEVRSGTLRVNTTLEGGGEVRVCGLAPGGPATLGGTGRIHGRVIVEQKAVLAPGSSIGTLEVAGEVELAGVLHAELGGALSDRLNVEGVLRLLPESELRIEQLRPPTSPVYILASYGVLEGTFSKVSGLPAGYSLEYNYEGRNEIALIPEPATGALAVLGLMLWFRRRTRRKSK